MVITLEAFVEALPRGTDVHTVLEALRDIGSNPPHRSPHPPLSTRPWYRQPSCSLETALALCELLPCALIPPPRKGKASAWHFLWERRRSWPPPAPSGCSCLRDAALAVALGMHPRAGRESPLQLLPPVLVRDALFVELLAPRPAVVAFCVPEGRQKTARSVRAVLVRPGFGGVRELERPPLACSTRPAKCTVSVRLVAHTATVVLLAVRFARAYAPRDSALPWPGSCTSFYSYDARSGELIGAFTMLGGWCTELVCCLDERTELLAICSPRRHRGNDAEARLGTGAQLQVDPDTLEVSVVQLSPAILGKVQATKSLSV
eukprot:m51a1_g14254 hypothetical protein (319) ;mRNA; r:271060-272590